MKNINKNFKIIIFFAVITLILSLLFSVTVFASYDPQTKADMITYRNFFGTARDVDVNGLTITAADYPPVILYNGGARDESYFSEANYNGGIFLFKDAQIKSDSNQIVLFYDYDQRHGDVTSAEYYIYAAAPGTSAEEAMTEANLTTVLSYDKEQQIYDEVATDTWTDFYSEANAGPMTGFIELKQGTYDIYVHIMMIGIDETFEDENLKNISAKLSDLVFMNDPNATKPVVTTAPPPTATLEPTPSEVANIPTADNNKTTVNPENTLAPDDNGDTPGEGPSATVIVIIVAAAAAVIAAAVYFFIKKKKK